MGREERHHAAGCQRIDDKHMRCCRIGVHRHLLIGISSLRRAPARAERAAGNFGAAPQLPYPANGRCHLDQHGGQRCQHRHRIMPNRPPRRPRHHCRARRRTSPPTAPCWRSSVRHRQWSRQSRRCRMSRFFTWASSWAITPFSSSTGKDPQDPFSSGHGGMFGIAAGGKGIRRCPVIR